MVIQVFPTMDIGNKRTKLSEQNQSPKVNFGSTAMSQTDTFENSKKQNKGAEFLMAGIAGSSLIFAGVKSHKFKVLDKGLDNILNTFGKDIPKGIAEKIDLVTNIASKDSLTGLLNKGTLLANVPKEYNEAVKNGKGFSVAMLDMDNFKGINEIFDHSKGDEVLKRIAANIQEVTQKHGAKSYRYGGEEFVISMNAKNAGEAKKIIQEIADAIKKDQEIQKNLPEFKKEAEDARIRLAKAIPTLDNIFNSMKKPMYIEEAQLTSKNIIEVLNDYIDKHNPVNKNSYIEIIEKIKSTPQEKLPEILSINTPINSNSTLAKELNKIYTQYKGTINDLQKWLNHVNEYNCFTISGGVVDNTCSKELSDGLSLVKIADEALKSSKENGKNLITIADEEITQKALEKIEK